MSLEENLQNLNNSINEFNKAIYPLLLSHAEIIGKIDFENAKTDNKLIFSAYQDNNLVARVIFNLKYYSYNLKIWENLRREIRHLERIYSSISIKGLRPLGFQQDIYHTSDEFSRIFLERADRVYAVK